MAAAWEGWLAAAAAAVLRWVVGFLLDWAAAAVPGAEILQEIVRPAELGV
jgi:hypothetical protein